MKPCPGYGTTGTVLVRPVLVGEPLGTYAIAGAQPKAFAEKRVALFCSACDLLILRHLEGAVFDADSQCFTAGHFVADGVARDDRSLEQPDD